MVAGIESYDAVKNELKFFATSSVRVKLLISLNERDDGGSIEKRVWLSDVHYHAGDCRVEVQRSHIRIIDVME